MLNIRFLLLVLIMSNFNVQAQEAQVEQSSMEQSETKSTETCDIIVHLTGLKSNEGQLMVALYDSEKTWLGKPFIGELTSIENKEATVVFKNVPYGIYAASAVHDEDMNDKLNTGIFGIPSEPYASSRGALGRFGPPKWADAKFTISTSKSSEAIKF